MSSRAGAQIIEAPDASHSIALAVNRGSALTALGIGRDDEIVITRTG